ncbi:9782_t:CDS:1, partial [Rhizophagus irregularis]
MSNFKRLCIFGEPRSETTPLVEFTIVGEPEDITVEVLDLLSQFSREIQ